MSDPSLASAKHLISLAEMSPSDLGDLLRSARDFQERRQVGLGEPVMENFSAAMLFESPSLRTRFAFESGLKELGAAVTMYGHAEVGMGRREPITDVAQTLSNLAHALVVRTPSHDRLTQFAEAASKPVYCAGTSLLHPVQALADALALQKRFGALDGLTICFLGSAGPHGNSWIELAATAGVIIRFAVPPGQEPDRALYAAAMERGAKLKVTRKPQEALANADAVYAGPWSQPPRNGDPEEFYRPFAPFRLTEQALALANPEAAVLHAMPVRRNVEVAREIVDSERCLMHDQAENMLHVVKAVMTLTM